MSRIKKALLFSVILIVCILGVLISQIIYISLPTQGDRIISYDNPRQALLVIDIQEDFTGTTAKPPFPYKDSKKLITAVNLLTEAASGKNMIMVYIRQELDGIMGYVLSNLFAGGASLKGNPGTDIDSRISIRSSHIFPKPRSDAFSNPDFESFLIENQVNEVYLVGLDAEGCVHTTAQGALNRGYIVHIITDAIVLKAEEKWEALLNEYRQEGIRLMQSQEFINNKQSESDEGL